MNSDFEKGFTLIEVVISSLILFSVLAVGINIFRTSILMMGKVTDTILISRALPAIMETVKTEIFQKKIEGKGTFNEAVTFEWYCTPAKTSQNIQNAYDMFTGKLQYGNFKIVLNTVFLTIRCGNDIYTKEKNYEYKELFWTR